MRWCRFVREGKPSYGIVEGDRITAVDGIPWGEHRRTSSSVALASAQLLIPVVPPNFLCAGINYAEHVRLMAKKRGVEPDYPKRAEIGYRAQSALCAHDEPIIKPKDSGPNFQYEGELVAVFGKRARKVSKESALDHVFGWTIGNDVSERDWQKSDRTMYRSKNTDTFKPMGPWIETDVDLDAMVTTIKLNGTVVDTFKTNNMIFDAPTFIAEVSRYCTIEPGDVMWLGTDMVPANMKAGDVCEIEISGIGTLRNPVVAES